MRSKSIGAGRAGPKGLISTVEPDRARFHAQSATDQSSDARDATTQVTGGGTKSLMKTSDLATKGRAQNRFGPLPSAPAAKARHQKPPAVKLASRNQKIEERIVAASEELASGITEAAS